MIKNMLSGIDVAEFRIWMGWADRYVILTHMGPDGDAIGSSLALCRYLKSKGKEAVVLVPDSAPDFLSWLPGAQDIKVFSDDPDASEDLVYKADVLCCLDFNVVGRIGKVAASFLYSKAKKFLLDHHPFPGANYTVTLSHPEASSTSELVFHLICALGDFNMIDKEMAQCIYTGIMTDTGAFTYASSRPEIFELISILLRCGIDKDKIYRNIFYTYSPNRLKFQGYMLYVKLDVWKKAHASIMTLTNAERRRFGILNGDTEGLVNLPLQILGMKLSIFLREDTEHPCIRVSLRSVDDFPCNEMAAEFFGGGGHKNAAGGEVWGTMDEAVALIKKAVQKYMPYLKD